jgi:ABC-type transport system involved in multi-copper enzyme maturation permease subunit
MLISPWQLIIRAVLIPVAVLSLATLGPLLSVGRPELQRYLTGDGLTRSLQDVSFVLAILVLSLSATTIAQEHGLGLLRNTLVREPLRATYLVGRFLAVGMVALGVAVVGAGYSMTLTWAVASAQGLPHSWLASAPFGVIARVAGLCVGFALIGAAVATVVRSAAAAIGISLAWLVALENIVVATFWKGGLKVLPGRLLERVVSTEVRSGSATLAQAIIGSALWVTALAGVAVLVFRRRDVS